MTKTPKEVYKRHQSVVNRTHDARIDQNRSLSPDERLNQRVIVDEKGNPTSKTSLSTLQMDNGRPNE